MEKPGQFEGHKLFSSPEEELVYLREQVAVRERELVARGAELVRDDVISDKMKDYHYTPTKNVLDTSLHVAPGTLESLALNLAPEAHDAKMAELHALLKEKGIKNALAAVELLDDPHIEDDFHRFLIQYIKKGLHVPDLTPRSELFSALSMSLYEVSLPEADANAQQKGLKELISAMDQFYAGMLSVGDAKDPDRYFTLEIANPNHSEEFIIYVSIPDHKKNLFEKQVLSLFPHAKVKEVPDDYNVFNEGGVTLGAVGTLAQHSIYPIKTYEAFDHDPLNVILNTFSKIQKDGEGAALQVVFRPASYDYAKEYKKTLEEVQKGTSVKEALPKSIGQELWSGVKYAFFSSTPTEEEKKAEKEKPKVVDQTAVEQINNKIGSPVCEITLRLVASAATEPEAERILSDIESGFHQFENTHGNKIVFKRIASRKLRKFAEEFSFRTFNSDNLLPLTFKELTTLFHFPGQSITVSPQLRQSKAATAAAPLDLPQTGTLLGVNRFRNVETKVYLTKEDRLRHFYTVGQTGTGKSTILKNMIAQDILQGEGVCMIDPHGNDIIDILAMIPKERYEDVIYFDPSYTPRPMGLNMLEYDRRFPEQKTFVVNELLSIFNKLFDMKVAGGPMFEQYFRNAVMLVIEDPDSGSTLLDVSRVLANKPFREMKLANCKNPIVVQFWREVADKAGGEAALANIVPYITSKFDVFLSNDIMRPIIAQEKSTFNFREIMDSKKILLVNLSKGRLGDINANLIGLILVGKILMAALSRADSVGKDMPPFYLYIDEFQNITTDSIAQILSEARKYKLSLNVAHQYIAQLQQNIRDAVFGNVGSLGVFRVGADDAEYLEKQFAPVFTARDIINIENRNAYLKILVNGKPVKPFNIETLPPPAGKTTHLEALKELSYLKFGKDRAIVEAEIMEKYKKAPPATPAPTPPTTSPPVPAATPGAPIPATPTPPNPSTTVPPLPSTPLKP
jgi:hypothetical protein